MRVVKSAERRQSKWLLAIVAAGIVGIGAELLFIAHTEGWKQQVPLYGLGVAMAALAWAVMMRGAKARLGLRTAMAALGACAIAGIVLHFQSNYEFKAELHPDAGAWTLFWETMRASSPPSLAPGALALLAAVGIVATMETSPIHGDEGERA